MSVTTTETAPRAAAAAAVRAKRRRPAPGRRRLIRRLTPWLFISPFLILFGVFTAFPLGFSIYLSFHEWNPVAGLGAMEWTGLDNYDLALTDPWLWKSLWNTAWLAVAAGVPQHLIAIPVAYLLVTALRAGVRQVYTATLFVPFVTSTVAVSLIFFSIYAPNTGILNQWLLALSETPVIGLLFGWVPEAMPIKWLSSSDLLKPSIAAVVVWKHTGFNVVIYSAGFLTVSRDLYDAAEVDGCTAWQKFWHVALPMIRPFVFFAVTLTIIGNLQLFEEPFILTEGNSGGTSQAGLTASYYLYLVGWEWLEMGSAAAVSWILFVFIGIATGVHFWFNGRAGLGGDR